MLTLTGGQILIGIATAGIRTAATGVAAPAARTVLRVGSIMLRCANAQIVRLDPAAVWLMVAHLWFLTLLFAAGATVAVACKVLVARTRR
jgi:hypothetical protein